MKIFKFNPMNPTGFALFLITCIGIINFSIGQDVTKYRRSSMNMVLVESSALGKSRDMVVEAYNSNPFPDKYNKHVTNASSFNVDKMTLTTADYISSGFYKDTLTKLLDILKASANPLRQIRYLNADSTKALQEPSENQKLGIYIDKYIRENDLAKSMAATWFNRTPDGKMNWDLIQERGMYSASAEQKDQANSVADKTTFLMDFDLIGNTYTVINYPEFYENEPVARLIRDIAKQKAMEQLAGKPEILVKKSMALIDTVYERTKVGYTVKCNSFLYKLDWNADIAKKVKDYFFSEGIDAVKAWDTTSLFKLNFLGKTTVASIVTFKIGEKRTEKEIIDLQIRRTMDNALAKLQKEHVQFRPVSPIATIGPVTAQIGLKEGLEKGDKFEILEMGWNELGIPVWKSIGKVSLDKKSPIWDNRQGAEVGVDKEGKPLPAFTKFKGGKNAMPGLHYLRITK